MAYPSVAAIGTPSGRGWGSDDLSVSMPSGITAGDLLLCLVFSGSAITMSASGWTTLSSNTSENRTFYLFGKVAAGSDTCTVTFSGNGDPCAVTFRINAWYGTLSAGVGYDLTRRYDFAGDQPDPPSTTATWGSADNLWIVCYASPNQPSGTPTGYDSNATTAYSGGVYGTAQMRTKDAASDSDDPSAFNNSSSGGHTVTVVVRPAGGGSIVPQAMASYRQQ